MFTTSLLVTAGSTVVIALLDKLAEEFHFYWLSTFLKLVFPIIGFALAIYFLEFNPLLRWLK